MSGVHRERLVMDRLALGAGRLGHGAERLRVGVQTPMSEQRHRQPDRAGRSRSPRRSGPAACPPARAARSRRSRPSRRASSRASRAGPSGRCGSSARPRGRRTRSQPEQRVGLDHALERRRDDTRRSTRGREPRRAACRSRPRERRGGQQRRPPAIAGLRVVADASASKKVERPSPMPATRKRTGAWAMIAESTSTTSGLRPVEAVLRGTRRDRRRSADRARRRVGRRDRRDDTSGSRAGGRPPWPCRASCPRPTRDQRVRAGARRRALATRSISAGDASPLKSITVPTSRCSSAPRTAGSQSTSGLVAFRRDSSSASVSRAPADIPERSGEHSGTGRSLPLAGDVAVANVPVRRQPTRRPPAKSVAARM